MSDRIPAGWPCDHPRGSWGKIEAMRLRFELGEHLYHDSDSMAAPSPEDRKEAIEKAAGPVRARRKALREARRAGG